MKNIVYVKKFIDDLSSDIAFPNGKYDLYQIKKLQMKKRRICF